MPFETSHWNKDLIDGDHDGAKNPSPTYHHHLPQITAGVVCHSS